MGKKRASRGWAPSAKVEEKRESLSERPEVNLAGGNHFATRPRANDFLRLIKTLPDPDPVLRKMGKGFTALKELLLDSHLESVWSIRCAATSGAEWFMTAGGEGRKEQEAADAFAAELKKMDVPRIIEEMMEAVAYGFSALEVLWKADNGRWGIENVVGKPQQWFEFNGDNKLVFRSGVIATEELPENRFLLVGHRSSYVNPYGDKIFSKCFWPVTFKRNGWRWWAVFVEKYGGAFMYGTYPPNAGEEFKSELFAALEKMISDSVAVLQEGSAITIESMKDKGGSSDTYTEFIKMANAEISKAVLGETLTTEIGDKGSYAAAQTHNEVREELAMADRRRISAAFNRLAAVYTFYNFGEGVEPPLFTFVKDEDLQVERAKRDVDLHTIGWYPRKAYIAREYGIPEEDFDLAEKPKEGSKEFGRLGHQAGCGCREGRGFFGALTSLFSSKGERAAGKDGRLMEEFGEGLLEAGQEEIDRAIEAYAAAMGKATNFDDAAQELMAEYLRRNPGRLASLANEIRYAASGIGGRRG